MVTLWLRNAYRKWKNKELYEYIKAQAEREYNEDIQKDIRYGRYRSRWPFNGAFKHVKVQAKADLRFHSNTAVQNAEQDIERQKQRLNSVPQQNQSVPELNKKAPPLTSVSSQAKEIEAKEIERVVEQDLAASKDQTPLTFEQQVEKHYKLETFIGDVKKTVSLYESQTAEERTAIELSYQRQLRGRRVSDGQKFYLQTILKEIAQLKADRSINQTMKKQKKKKKHKR